MLKNKDRVDIINSMGDSLDEYDDGRRMNIDVFKPKKDEFGIFIEEANALLRKDEEKLSNTNKGWVLAIVVFILVLISGVYFMINVLKG